MSAGNKPGTQSQLRNCWLEPCPHMTEGLPSISSLHPVQVKTCTAIGKCFLMMGSQGPVLAAMQYPQGTHCKLLTTDVRLAAPLQLCTKDFCTPIQKLQRTQDETASVLRACKLLQAPIRHCTVTLTSAFAALSMRSSEFCVGESVDELFFAIMRQPQDLAPPTHC